MSLRVGTASDDRHAISMAISKDTVAAGFALAGFGTVPHPGCVSDDPITYAIQYTAHHIQRVLSVLVNREMNDAEGAGEALHRQMHKINDSINYINQHLGHSSYLAGCVCYVVGEQYQCLPFGGAAAYLCSQNQITPIKNQMHPNSVYVYDAIGGNNLLPIAFEIGTLPVGSQIICTTQPVQEGLLEEMLQTLTATNPQYAAEYIHATIQEQNLPIAVLDILQAAHFTGKPSAQGGAENDQCAT